MCLLMILFHVIFLLCKMCFCWFFGFFFLNFFHFDFGFHILIKKTEQPLNSIENERNGIREKERQSEKQIVSN